MRIFNESKTHELNRNDLNFEQGYLKADKLFISHHETIPFKKGKTVEEIAEELKEQGVGISIGFDGRLYKIIREIEGYGRQVEPIEDEPDTEAQEAWDEYEDIQVYIPYTEEELKHIKKERLRAIRIDLLAAFDKWEKAVLRGREEDDKSIMEWYRKLLDLEEVAFEKIPERVRYYYAES